MADRRGLGRRGRRFLRSHRRRCSATLTSEGEVTGETDSKRVDELRFERFQPTAEDFQQQVSEVVVISLEDGTVDDPAVEERVQALADELREVGATNVVTHADQEDLVSEDGRPRSFSSGSGRTRTQSATSSTPSTGSTPSPASTRPMTGEVTLDEDFSGSRRRTCRTASSSSGSRPR